MDASASQANIILALKVFVPFIVILYTSLLSVKLMDKIS